MFLIWHLSLFLKLCSVSSDPCVMFIDRTEAIFFVALLLNISNPFSLKYMPSSDNTLFVITLDVIIANHKMT